MTKAPENDGPAEDSLTSHLTSLAADADDIAAFFTRQHEAGEIHHEELARSERLSASLKDVIAALKDNEPLAMSSSDVWAMLNRKHRNSDRTVT